MTEKYWQKEWEYFNYNYKTFEIDIKKEYVFW